MQENLTQELSRLVRFTSDVAIAIRNASKKIRCTYFSSRRNTEPQSDVFWLSQSLHNLSVLSDAIESGSSQTIERSCNFLIDYLNETAISNKKIGRGGSPNEAFSRNNIDPKVALKIFADIKEKLSTPGRRPEESQGEVKECIGIV